MTSCRDRARSARKDKAIHGLRDKILHLPSWDESRFDVAADPELLGILMAQMQAADPARRPADCWMLTEAEMRLPLADFLEPLNGDPGPILLKETLGPETLTGDRLQNMRYARQILIPFYEAYLRAADTHGLLDGITLRDLAARNWRVLDLESLMDFLHLAATGDFPDAALTIVEVGAGFGRLPEFLIKGLGRKIRYINIDAVPASMMWFHVFMRRTFPDLKIGTLTDPATTDIADFDVLTIPAWHLAAVTLPQADIGINIESMQEMSQPLVDFYIALLDRVVRPGGRIMLVNSREHEFIGDWKFPPHWRCLFRHRSTRAWTEDYRTELFEKTDRDCSAENAIRELTYQRELALTRYYRAAEEAAGRKFNPHSVPDAAGAPPKSQSNG